MLVVFSQAAQIIRRIPKSIDHRLPHAHVRIHYQDTEDIERIIFSRANNSLITIDHRLMLACGSIRYRFPEEADWVISSCAESSRTFSDQYSLLCWSWMESWNGRKEKSWIWHCRNGILQEVTFPLTNNAEATFVQNTRTQRFLKTI